MSHGIHLSGQELFTHYLCRSDFQNNRKTSIYMRLHIVSTKKIIKYFKQQPPVLCLFCSGVQCSITDQGHSTSRSQHCFVLKPYFPHAWCEIFEMFFKSTTWKLVMQDWLFHWKDVKSHFPFFIWQLKWLKTFQFL